MENQKIKNIALEDLPKGPDALRSASNVSTLVALDSVVIQSGNFSLIEHATEQDQESGDRIILRATTALTEDDPDLVVIIKMGITLPPAEVDFDSEEPEAELNLDGVVIDAEYRVVYKWASEQSEGTSAVDIHCFSRINSVYNIWPYWREFVHSTMMRMGLPAFMMPLLTAKRAVELVGLSPVVEEDATPPEEPPLPPNSKAG